MNQTNKNKIHTNIAVFDSNDTGQNLISIPELLAPAGNMQALVAAVQNGADAVYLGGSRFNAREKASNFNDQELIQAIDYCHIRGVKAYLALNTLVNNSELKQLLDFAEFAFINGIDAVIIQDIGLGSLLNKHIPDLQLHASTQMSIHDTNGVKAAISHGFKRIVLARELSLMNIKKIYDDTNAELEVFIHGALCMSYSGQCYLSSFQGGRSGNRGKCAQPCRLEYFLDNNSQIKGSLLSPKDICGLSLLPDYIKAGVSSLKIEGRLKSPEYVALTTSIYRKYIDIAISLIKDGNDIEYKKALEKDDIYNITQIFNRGAFTQSYALNNKDVDMMCPENPKNWGVYLGKTGEYSSIHKSVQVKLQNDIGIGDGIEIWADNRRISTIVTRIYNDNKMVQYAKSQETVYIGDIKEKISQDFKIYKTSSKKLNLQARETYINDVQNKKIPLFANFYAKDGQKAKLIIFDKDKNTVEVFSEEVLETANKAVISKERLTNQLSKLNGTPFELLECDIEIKDSPMVRMSTINKMRREAVKSLEDKRVAKYKKKIYSKASYTYERDLGISNSFNNRELELSLFFYRINDYDFSRLESKRLFIYYNELDSFFNKFDNLKGKEIYAWIPPIVKDSELKKVSNIINKYQNRLIGIEVSNIGHIKFFKEKFELLITCGQGTNLFNNESINLIKNMGAKSFLISPELSMVQINDMFINNISMEILCYGRIHVMTTECCLKGFYTKEKCKGAGNITQLSDRMNEKLIFINDCNLCRNIVLSSRTLKHDNIDEIRETNAKYIRLCFSTETFNEVLQIENYYNNKITFKKNESIQKLSGRYITGHYYSKGV